MSSDISLSIVIPAYNEEEIIVSSIQQTIDAVAGAVANYEVIVVDDGSADTTQALVKANLHKWDHIRLVINEQNGGFGAAVRTGIAAATKEYILCVPVDSPMDRETLLPFLALAPSTDIIASYRIERVGYTAQMRFNSWVYHKMVRAIFGLKLRDYNWIHLYRRAIFQKVSFRSRGIFMMVELLVEAHRHGYRIAEIPVTQKERITGIATSVKFSTIKFVLVEMAQYLKR